MNRDDLKIKQEIRTSNDFFTDMCIEDNAVLFLLLYKCHVDCLKEACMLQQGIVNAISPAVIDRELLYLSRRVVLWQLY